MRKWRIKKMSRIYVDSLLKKCRGKLNCLIFEMLFFTKEKKPKLKTQSDSIKAKLFVL